MTTSNLNSAIIMGFFAAAIGLIVICFASLQDSQAATKPVNSETFAAAHAEDILQP